jgi:hypothetical protein
MNIDRFYFTFEGDFFAGVNFVYLFDLWAASVDDVRLIMEKLCRISFES